MKLRILFFSLLLCTLLPGIAHSQCNVVTTTNYATAYTFTTNSTGSDVIQTVVVDGSATMNMQTGCPDSIVSQFNANKQYITHFPYIVNTVNGVGGRAQGPTFCAECYSSYQTSVDSGPLQPGVEVPTQSGGEIDCSMAGVIFLASGDNPYVSIHKTTYSFSSVSGGICYYTVFCPTSPHICGPDEIAGAAPCPSPFKIAYYLKLRIGVYSTCFNVGLGYDSAIPESCY